STPLKKTEKRAKKWREATGREQTEIDALIALHPDVLPAAVYEAIKPYYDSGLDGRVNLAEEKWRGDAKKAVKAEPEQRAPIEKAGKAAGAAIRKLEHQRQLAAVAMRKHLPPAPELPEVELSEEAPEPLFDSEWDFVTATKKLIAHRELAGGDAEEE